MARRSASGVDMAMLLRGVALSLAACRALAVDPGIPSDYVVVHANVVMRHGERSRLVKSTAAEFGVNDGVTLTPEGAKQCYDLGANLRKRYITSENTTTTAISGLRLYDGDRVQVVSSGYDRTLESAAALVLGLYPPGQIAEDIVALTDLPDNHLIVPIHSSDPENDAVILASDKCPVYSDNWVEFYRTAAFQEKQTEAYEFIDDVFNWFESAKTTSTPLCWDEANALYTNRLELHAPYNLWDCARVLYADGEKQVYDYIMEAKPPADFTSATNGWDYLTELVKWIEDQKYEQQIVRRMIGGLYVGEMNARMAEVIDHYRGGQVDTVGRFAGMHVTVGHYPTLKGIAGVLDIGGLEGIPDYASHLSFELLYNASANWRDGEDDFGVRIMYQAGTDESTLKHLHMSPVYDSENELGLDDYFNYERNSNGVMGWHQWTYLMDHQVRGGPAYYEKGEEDWCLDCLSTQVDTCLKLELKEMTQMWKQAVGETQDAIDEKEAVDDGIEGYHVALLSIFGAVLGVGFGICIRPCLERRKNRAKNGGAVGGNVGLEGWGGRGSGIANGNGTFRLGSKYVPTRHVLSGTRGGSRAMAVPTSDDLDDSYEGYEIDDRMEESRIPDFAPTSALGEPVPFPHRRQPSGMMTGVDGRMMSGIDGEEDLSGETRSTSPSMEDDSGSPMAATHLGGSWEADVLSSEQGSWAGREEAPLG